MDFIAKSERLDYLAYHNPVTGLPNRAAFRDACSALQGRPVVVAVLDIRRFPYINDSRGRGFGEKLLRQVGSRLAELGPDAVVAHPEADTFLVAFPASSLLESEGPLEGACVDSKTRVPSTTSRSTSSCAAGWPWGRCTAATANRWNATRWRR